MKKILATSAALATVIASLASPAFAAPPGHRAHVADDTVMAAPYGQVTRDHGTQRSEVVTGSGSAVIADPDPNIMTQLLRDPDPVGF